MANKKISQLPLYTGNTAGTWLVMNDSGETTTYKVNIATVLQSGTSGTSGTSGSSGTSGTSGSSGSSGTAGSSGTSGSSGSSGSSGTSGSSGSSGTSGSSGVINISNPSNGRFLYSNASGNAATASANITISNNYNVNISGSLRFNDVPAFDANFFTTGNLSIGSIHPTLTTGSEYNTLFGQLAGYGLTTGDRNTGVGWFALGTNNVGFGNNAFGFQSLLQNKIGERNVAFGNDSIRENISGSFNTAIGYHTLKNNLNGDGNIALGYAAGITNISGSYNLFISSYERLTYAEEVSGSIIYGQMNVTPSNQKLRLNANTTISNGLNVEAGNVLITGSLRITGSATITGSVNGNVNALSISSNTASLNLNDANFFTLQLVSGSATHINPSNIKPGQTINILVNTTGSATVSFPSSVKQPSGSAYVPTTSTGKDVLTLVSFDASNLYLASVKNLI